MSVKYLIVAAVVCIGGGYLLQNGFMPKGMSGGGFSPKSITLVAEQMQDRQSCIAEFEMLKSEINMRLQYAQFYGDMRAIQAYRTLAYQVRDIELRLQRPDCNTAQEREQIRIIKTMLAPRRK